MSRTPRLLPALSLALVTLAAVLGGACDEQAPARSPVFRDAPALVDEIERCIPSCAVDDSRVLAISTTGTGTIADIDMSFLVIADGDVRDLEVFIFDGDTADTDADGLHHWDLGSPQLAPQLAYKLYELPNADGTGAALVLTESSVGMPDNAWHPLSTPVSESARRSDGRYYYRLDVEITDPQAHGVAGFKVGTRADTSILTTPGQPFAFIASIGGLGDALAVWPDYAETGLDGPSNYDGTFDFFFRVPEGLGEFTLVDGDLDRNLDTDDPNTPNDGYPFLPAIHGDPEPEGVAVGGGGLTGAPNDDSTIAHMRRSPDVFYDVVGPLELPEAARIVATNDNPTGHREYERFVISAETDDPALVDVFWPQAEGETIPGGTYAVKLQGMDMHNFNIWYSPYYGLCVETGGEPCCQDGECDAISEGCTPGYWKNLGKHGDEWGALDPAALVDEVFGISNSVDGELELHAALTLGGGGERALLRHAVAALLSARHPDVNYLYRPEDVVAMVQGAYASGQHEAVKNLLDVANNAGCGLS
ncbi:MAG: hypothetical protein H6713_25630 [Myxococcales bacterium]|nr:hypothetical protein [Myxococcales bacterium]